MVKQKCLHSPGGAIILEKGHLGWFFNTVTANLYISWYIPYYVPWSSYWWADVLITSCGDMRDSIESGCKKYIL